MEGVIVHHDWKAMTQEPSRLPMTNIPNQCTGLGALSHLLLWWYSNYGSCNIWLIWLHIYSTENVEYIFVWHSYIAKQRFRMEIIASITCLQNKNQNKKKTHVWRTHPSPSSVSPTTWLPACNWQASPILAEGPTVQKGPIETPCKVVQGTYKHWVFYYLKKKYCKNTYWTHCPL